MLYSQGVPLEMLGIPRRDGTPGTVEHRHIWQTFADHFYLFHGTPTGVWRAHELYEVFGIQQKLTSATAQAIYDELVDKLARPEYRPRAVRAVQDRSPVHHRCGQRFARPSQGDQGIGVEGDRAACFPSRRGRESLDSRLARKP
jgi:Glucuronate isomerase